MFLLGGIDDDEIPQSTVFLLNTSNRSWSKKQPLFDARSSFDIAWAWDVNDNAAGVRSGFAVGGNSGNQPALNVLEVLNPELD